MQLRLLARAVTKPTPNAWLEMVGQYAVRFELWKRQQYPLYPEGEDLRVHLVWADSPCPALHSLEAKACIGEMEEVLDQ